MSTIQVMMGPERRTACHSLEDSEWDSSSFFPGIFHPRLSCWKNSTCLDPLEMFWRWRSREFQDLYSTKKFIFVNWNLLNDQDHLLNDNKNGFLLSNLLLGSVYGALAIWPQKAADNILKTVITLSFVHFLFHIFKHNFILSHLNGLIFFICG